MKQTQSPREILKLPRPAKRPFAGVFLPDLWGQSRPWHRFVVVLWLLSFQYQLIDLLVRPPGSNSLEHIFYLKSFKRSTVQLCMGQSFQPMVFQKV